MKVGKASGVDDVLPDLRKALSDTADGPEWYDLAPSVWLSSVEDIKSRKDAALQSHHYLVTIDLAIVLPKKNAKQRMRQPEVAHLQNPLYRSEFADNFCTQVKKATVADEQDTADNLNSYAKLIGDSMHCAVEETLPLRTAIPKRPWIRNDTLELIELEIKRECIARRPWKLL